MKKWAHTAHVMKKITQSLILLQFIGPVFQITIGEACFIDNGNEILCEKLTQGKQAHLNKNGDKQYS